MLQKSLKTMIFAAALLSINAYADRVAKVLNTANQTINVDLKTTSGYKTSTSLKLGEIYSWTIPADKGCLSSVSVNGKEMWSGNACDDNITITIYPSYPDPIGINVS